MHVCVCVQVSSFAMSDDDDSDSERPVDVKRINAIVEVCDAVLPSHRTSIKYRLAICQRFYVYACCFRVAIARACGGPPLSAFSISVSPLLI